MVIVKRLFVGICLVVGVLFLAEWSMPGHLDRLETYLMGNLDAMSTWWP